MTEIFRGQKFRIEGEVYRIVEIRVTAIASPGEFMVSAFFESLERNSANPFFEENIRHVIDSPVFEPIGQ